MTNIKDGPILDLTHVVGHDATGRGGRAAVTVPAAKVYTLQADAIANESPLVGTDRIETLGRTSVGLGAAAYLRNDTLIRGGFTDMAGQDWRPTLDHPLKPETFGAKGGDAAFDDSSGFWECAQSIMERGRGVMTLTPGRTYYMGDSAPNIILDTRSISVEGFGADLNFSTRSFSDPALKPEMTSGGDFTSLSAWAQNPYAGGNVTTISDGKLTWSGAAALAGGYAGAAQAITLVNGVRYRITADIYSIDYSGAGINYLSISFRDGNDSGGSLGGSTISATAATVVNGSSNIFTADFTHEGATGEYWLSIKANNPFQLESVSCKTLPFNTALTLSGNGASGVSGQYGHIGQFFQNMRVNGGWDGIWVAAPYDYGDAMLFNTTLNAHSTRALVRNVKFSNWNRCVVLENRTYLTKFDHCSMGEHIKRYGVHRTEGTDSGENDQFDHCTFSASEACVKFEHGYQYLTNCSLDYGGAFIAMSGSGTFLHCFGCHFERSQGAVSNQKFFDIESGTLKLDGGYIQLNVSSPNVIESVFNLGGGGRVIVDDTQAFGLTTASEEIVSGTGVYDVGNRFSGIGQKTMSPFPQRTPYYNRAMESSTNSVSEFIWDCWAIGGTRVNAFETANFKVTTLTSGVRTVGNSGVQIEKLVGIGTGGGMKLAFPIPETGMVSFEVYNKFLAHATDTGTRDVYLDAYTEALMPSSTYGVYMTKYQTRWMGESSGMKGIVASAGRDWTRWMVNGTQNTSGGRLEFGDARRTHLVLIYNLAALELGTKIQVCDPFVGVL